MKGFPKAEAIMQRDSGTAFASPDWRVRSYGRGGRSISIQTHMTRYEDFLAAAGIFAIYCTCERQNMVSRRYVRSIEIRDPQTMDTTHLKPQACLSESSPHTLERICQRQQTKVSRPFELERVLKYHHQQGIRSMWRLESTHLRIMCDTALLLWCVAAWCHDAQSPLSG